MSYRIELIPPARAEIRSLPGYVRLQAIELVTALGDEPRPPRARVLQLPASGTPEIRRIWLAGRWRMAYEIDESDQRVLILCLRRKEDVDFETLPSWMHDSGGIELPPQRPGLRPDRTASSPHETSRR